MSTKHRKNRPRESDAAKNTGAAAPRSLREIYEAKKRNPGQRKSSGAQSWVLLGVILVAGIGAYAAFRSVSNPARKSDAAATNSAAAPTSKPAPKTLNAAADALAALKSAARAAEGPPTGPRVQFASTTYDFGRAPGDDLVDCFFYYTNTGIATLELTNVSPGCGCMTVRDWTKKLDPGQSGSITVKYDSHHYTGPFAKSVFVTCNDPGYPNPMLEIKGFVFRPIELSPMNAAIMLTSETPSNSAAVKIISHLEEPLTLSPPMSSTPAFAVELRTNVPGKEYQLVVSTSIQQSGGFLNGSVTMKTSATNAPVLTVSAIANVLPVVGAIPNAIRLGPPPYTNAVPFNLWIRNNSSNALALSEAKVNAPGVEVQIKEEQPGTQFAVTITFPPGFEVKPGEPAELTVKCNHPSFPLLTVPVIQQPRAQTVNAAVPP